MAAQGFEVIVLVNCLVQDATRLGASDLHIEPWEDSIAVRARVNGVLSEVAHLPLDLMEKISMRFKVMANLVTYQAGTPQDGTAAGGPELEGVQLRVSIFPTVRGEKIVVRLFDPRDRRFELGTLGYEETTLHGLLHVLKRSSGLVLFTGPTGSGKTSTMYSSLCCIMQRDGTSISITGSTGDHGWRDPRSGNRGDCSPGGPHRAPRYQHDPLRDLGGRLYTIDQYADRAFHAGLKHSWRDGAAFGAPELSGLLPTL